MSPVNTSPIAYKTFSFLSSLIFSGSLVCCTTARSNRVTDVTLKSSAQPDGTDTLDPLLIKAISEKSKLKRVFAWGGSETDGETMWIDSEERLRWARFLKSDVGYQLFMSEVEDRHYTKAPDRQETAAVAEYLQDTEFPVKVDTIRVGDCSVSVILLWRAKLRSFTGDSADALDIANSGLRVLVQRNASTKSNSTVDFDWVYPDVIAVDDVTGDGLQDYAFVGRTGSSTTINIWSLTESCDFHPLMFVEEFEGKRDRTQFLEDRAIKLEKDNDGRFSIHVWTKVPFKAESTEQVFRWNQAEEAFTPFHQS